MMSPAKCRLFGHRWEISNISELNWEIDRGTGQLRLFVLSKLFPTRICARCKKEDVGLPRIFFEWADKESSRLDGGKK